MHIVYAMHKVSNTASQTTADIFREMPVLLGKAAIQYLVFLWYPFISLVELSFPLIFHVTCLSGLFFWSVWLYIVPLFKVLCCYQVWSFEILMVSLKSGTSLATRSWGFSRQKVCLFIFISYFCMDFIKWSISIYNSLCYGLIVGSFPFFTFMMTKNPVNKSPSWSELANTNL